MSTAIYTAEPDQPAETAPTEETDRERLEANAKGLRARLARTLESLDRRRHDALNVKVQAERHPLPLVLAGAGALVAVAGGTGLSIYRARHRPRNQVAERLSAVARAWKHPNQVAHPDKRSLAAEIARGVVASLATYAISRLAKGVLEKLFPPTAKEAQKGTRSA